MVLRVLTGSQVDVWLASPDVACVPAEFDRLLAWLSADERARLTAFRTEASRREHLVARARLRSALSRYADLPPETWRFATDERGRPHLEAGHHDLDLRFSVSHTTGLVACAITIGQDVGIDVEHAGARVSPLALAERFFAPSEAADIRRRAPGERMERFLRYWTLKEAWLKARGVGLAGSRLRTCAFRLADGDDDPHVDREGLPRGPGGDENCRGLAHADVDGRAWRFWQWRPTAHHTLAVAVERPAHGPVDLRVVESEPLA